MLPATASLAVADMPWSVLAACAVVIIYSTWEAA
jgi:hypothetical protein